MVRLTEARDTGELESLKTDWLELQESSGCPNIFQSYQWVSLWWKHFGAGREMRVVFAWDDGAPVLAAPLYLERKSRMGIPVRRITAIGNNISSHHGFLAGRDSLPAVESCFESLFRDVKGWDLVELKKVPEGDTVIRLMRNFGDERDLRFIEMPSNRHHFLDVEGTFEDFLKNTASKRLRKTLRNRLNRLEKTGDVRFIHEDDLVPEETFDEIVKLAEKSWKHRAGIDPITCAAKRNFFREALKTFHDQGMLSLTALELNGKKIAFDLSFVMKETFFAYYCLFDENLCNLSPGKIITAHMVERCFGDGVMEMDFSEGEEEYKLEWSQTSRGYQEAYLLNRKSPAYPFLLAGLLLRKKVKSSPRLRTQVLKFKHRLRKRRIRGQQN